MRVFLGGRDVPRAEFALAGIGESTGVPMVILFEDGEVFTPADYISLGYTHVEVWCVGAVGGRGGDATETVRWRTTHTEEIMPGWVWEEVLQEADHVNGPDYRYTGIAPAGTPQPPYGVYLWDVQPSGGILWVASPRAVAEMQNPTHTATITHYLEPYVLSGGEFTGGGGGGGGLHVVASRLDELPISLIAEVGQMGADGAPGQAKQAAPYNSAPSFIPSPSSFQPMSEARWNWLNRFPNGEPLIAGPDEGGAGGHSALGDICRASGGKGGKPAISWEGINRIHFAHGGEGGSGDRVEPGGGAAGSISSFLPGKDGTWDGSIGKGGGGGRGGLSTVDRISWWLPTGGVTEIRRTEATEGGRGSLNYADTSVYGARGPLGTYTIVTPNVVAVYDPMTNMTHYELDGTFTEAVLSTRVNPGSGGGARVPGQRKYGSRAVGYNHNGIVLLRITKIA